MVIYKREGRDRWLRPGKVVFQDGKVVFIRHSGVFVRVSPNRLNIMNTIYAEDGIDDKCALEQNSGECTDKMDDQNINTETNSQYQNTYQQLIWRL